MRQDIFEEIENCLLDNNYAEHHTVIVGDLNAHTSMLNDYVELDAEVLQELNIRNVGETLGRSKHCTVNRANSDTKKSDLHGRKIIEICKNSGLCILNGRLNGDREGKFTTVQNACIDYVIADPSALQLLDSLDIEDFDPLFSDVRTEL